MPKSKFALRLEQRSPLLLILSILIAAALNGPVLFRLLHPSITA